MLIFIGSLPSLHGGNSLEPMNLWALYGIGADIRPVGTLSAEGRIADNLRVIYSASFALEYLLDELGLPLEQCRGSASTLKASLASLIDANPEETIGAERNREIRENLKAFETIFRNELPFVPAYCVTPKSILSTPKLVNAADEMFTEAIRSRLPPKAVNDIRSAGRCLAFNLPTAVGFHILRALEAIAVDYVVRASGSKPTKRDLGEYIRLLANNGAHADVTFSIDQIRKLYRNPLMHPEDELDSEEAVDLFLLCRSAINTTIRDMEDRKLFDAPVPVATAVANVP
jgi:hypothetical protein